MSLNFGQNFFAGGVFGNPKQLGVFGQSGMDVGILGQELDFEFGDVVVLNNPDDQVLQKFEGNFFFGHTFIGATINTGIWTVTDAATATVTQANSIITLDANDDAAMITHKVALRQTLTGDIIFEARVRRNADGTNSISRVGLDAGGADYIQFELNTDENTWRPAINRGGTTNGNDFTIPNNTWVKFKIIVETNSAKFYVNDKLQQTLTGVNVPDDRELRIRLRAEEAAGDSCILDIEWVKIEWGATV